MMRRRLASRVLLIVGLLVFLFVVWRQIASAKNDEQTLNVNTKAYGRKVTVDETEPTNRVKPFRSIKCDVNGLQSVQCITNDSAEVYLPFHGFVRDYFQVYGTLKGAGSDDEVFEFRHSSAKLHRPVYTQYSTAGAFGHFFTYNVAERDRVACINAASGVPMSTQWKPEPYYYPIQIAQFGLEHYSKSLNEMTPTVFALTGQESKNQAGNGGSVPLGFSSRGQEGSWCFDSPEYTPLSSRPMIPLTHDNLLLGLRILRFSLMALSEDIGFTVSLRRTDTSMVHRVRFESDLKAPIRIVNKTDVIFGLSPVRLNKWHRISRDLFVDLLHSQGQVRRRKAKRARFPFSSVVPLHVTFTGRGCVLNMTLQTHAHVDHFLDAADWFVNHQDASGGWTIPVKHAIADGLLTLQPGWYSAMAQGHAMSLLCRAFLFTSETVYLKAAVRALDVFKTNASAGGVVNYFLQAVPWYEEYPTVPGTFVLNGFMYSLFGLYDLVSCSKEANAAGDLYRQGLKSLNTLLSLFDTGSGSLYDLRHVSLHTAPNVARWDYHSVHVFQLLWLYTIEKNNLYSDTAERWIRFMNGDKVKST